MRLEIGASGHPVYSDGWIVTNLPELDALDERQWRSLFRPRTVDRVLAEHVVEHWTPAHLSTFLGILRTYLAPRGFLRLAVPDGRHPNPSYIAAVEPGGVLHQPRILRPGSSLIAVAHKLAVSLKALEESKPVRVNHWRSLLTPRKWAAPDEGGDVRRRT